MKSCVFAGSFDPITLGHEDIVDKCLSLYDTVYVALGENTEKKSFFSKEQRLEMIREIYKDNGRVKVCSFNGFLVDFMRENGIKDTVRGIRNGEDFRYETIMKENNKKYDPSVNTVFIFALDDKKDISSTVVREKILKGDRLEGCVSSRIIPLIEKYVKDK